MQNFDNNKLLFFILTHFSIIVDPIIVAIAYDRVIALLDQEATFSGKFASIKNCVEEKRIGQSAMQFLNIQMFIHFYKINLSVKLDNFILYRFSSKSGPGSHLLVSHSLFHFQMFSRSSFP